MGSSFTVYFEGPFWVGVFETWGDDAGDRASPGGYRAVRNVFGAEPSNAELLAFMLGAFHSLVGSDPGVREPCPVRLAGSLNPKRAQREACRELRRPLSTKAQASLSASLEARKAESKACQRRELSEAEAQRRRQRAEKRKARHRGH